VSVALLIFWLSMALILYTFIGFPLLVIIKGLLFPIRHEPASITPGVSLIISAYNEASGIEAKLKNIGELDYPPELFEAIIASDGSTDNTNEIVARYANERIKLLALPRLGKAGALNEAVARSRGEILVFSDANSLYNQDAIRQLTRHFADKHIGGVAGNQRYLKDKVKGSALGETSYWSFDRQLKIWESNAGNTVSATGAIYAIRRSLFQDVPAGVTDDFATSTRVIVQGYRLVFEPNAIAYEHVARNQQREFRRKVRIITRGLAAVVLMRELLNPFRYGFYALQLFTHKVLRRLIYIPLLLIFISNFWLLSSGVFYILTLLGQLVVYGLAALGFFLLRTGRSLPHVVALPTYVCMVYVASALATWNLLRGERIVQWTTEQRAT
jgi:cellulose synthase/poly-beta-1,6-N-acetylglucosamine synthase-like glycosyltransferase